MIQIINHTAPPKHNIFIIRTTAPELNRYRTCDVDLCYAYSTVKGVMQTARNDMDKISIENAEHYNWGESCDGWHLVKTETLSVIQERVPSGCSEVRHLHKYSEQFFYILSGVATLEVEGTENILSASQGMHIPANVAHQLKNEGSEDLIFLVTSTPPSHGDKIEKHA